MNTEQPQHYENLWTRPTTERGKLVLQKLDQAQSIRPQLFQRLESSYGSASRELLVAQVVTQLEEPFAQIAASQLDNFSGQPRSWFDYNPEAGQKLIDIIENLTAETAASTLANQAPHFLETLVFLKELVRETDGSKFSQLATQLQNAAQTGWQAGEPALLIPFYDAYVDANRAENDLPKVWVANAQLFLHTDPEQEQQLQAQTQIAWQQLQKLHQQPELELPKTIIGESIIGLGTELFSATIGQGLETSGFSLALNHLAKRQPYLEKVQHIFPTINNEIWSASKWLMIIHELGHNFDKFYQQPNSINNLLFTELRNDVGALLLTIENQPAPNQEILSAILMEIASGIFEDTPAQEAVFDGYAISGKVLLNVLFLSSVITEKESGEFLLNENIEELKTWLNLLFEKLTQPEAQEENRLLVAELQSLSLQPAAERLVEQMKTLSE